MCMYTYIYIHTQNYTHIDCPFNHTKKKKKLLNSTPFFHSILPGPISPMFLKGLMDSIFSPLMSKASKSFLALPS